MTERTPIETRNLDIYGNAPLPWTRPRDQFAAGIFFSRPAFLGTVHPDGRPHAAAVATLWLDGDIISPAGRVRANPAIGHESCLHPHLHFCACLVPAAETRFSPFLEPEPFV